MGSLVAVRRRRRVTGGLASFTRAQTQGLARMIPTDSNWAPRGISTSTCSEMLSWNFRTVFMIDSPATTSAGSLMQEERHRRLLQELVCDRAPDEVREPRVGVGAADN